MKKFLALAGFSALALSGVILFRTLTIRRDDPVPPPPAAVNLSEKEVVGRLSRAVQFPTVTSLDGERFDKAVFQEFHQFLESSFPLVHQELKKETVSGFSLLYEWPGADPALQPLLLLAHMDVVPVEADDIWTHPGFSGIVDDGYIWGRGTMDDKGSLLGILEAIEHLLGQGFRPARSVYLAFGHTEEIGGYDGAKNIAELLKKRGVKPAFVLDEGGSFVTENPLGVPRPIALPGIAEKGALNLELTVQSDGGHSSIPPSKTAIGILSEAIVRLQSNPFPARIEPPGKALLERLAPDMPFAQKMAASNLWLFQGLIKRRLMAQEVTRAGLQTTIAPTLIEGGVKENVLPTHARAVVNFRLLPGDTVNYVTERTRDIVNDPRVKIEQLGFNNDPSPVSSWRSDKFRLLTETILQTEPRAVVAPYLVIAATDSRHYIGLGGDIYRFLPLYASMADLARIHGVDERISIANYKETIAFYVRLIMNADAKRFGSDGKGR